jgi:predicted outer membrane protein
MKRVMYAAALGVLMTSVAWAQNQEQRPFQKVTSEPLQGPTGEQPHARMQTQTGSTFTDAQIAALLNLGNEKEVNVAKLAEKKAQRQDVKDLAAKMVTAHTQLWQQLNQIAAQGGLGEQPRESQGERAQQPQAMTGQNQAGGLNFLAIEQQIGRQCEVSLLHELQDKQGDKFDKAYVGWNIGAHMQMIDQIKVLRGYASPQVQQVLAQAEQHAQNHLDHFKKLMRELDSNSSHTP